MIVVQTLIGMAMAIPDFPIPAGKITAHIVLILVRRMSIPPGVMDVETRVSVKVTWMETKMLIHKM